MAAAAATLCPDDLRRLLQAFAAAQFRPKDCNKGAYPIQEMCCQLFERDYPNTIRIQNTAGELCASYPLTLVIPRAGRANPVAGGEVDAGKLRDLMLKARVARCRARFPVPVILFDGKYVCRSATLSGGPEIYGRSGFDLLFPAANEEEDCDVPVSFSSLSLSDSSQVCSKVRAQDIHLLQQLGVGHICDLMVEKKKVKFGVYITSSEKADKEGRYSAFRILSLPYPGVEFFRTYRDQGYAAEGLVFDWTQHFVDAVLDVPDPAPLPDVQWADYRQWDIINLTQNYLRLFLRCLMSSDSSGLLIHCISGWDRTPLFVSLLRLVLWADGLVHQSLSPLEITFLTLAYDWYLFGHNLNDRLQKGEDILFFCFYFLQFLSSDDFSPRAMRDDGLQSDGLDRSGSCTSLTSSGSHSCSGSYPNTPPTLTNSENGAHFLADCSSITSDSSNNSSSSHLHPDVAGASATTPVPIPVPDRRNSCKLDESWQFVSETGSIKDSPRGMPFNSPDSQDSISLSSAHMHRNGLPGADSPTRVRRRNPKDERQIRRQKRTERLHMVRTTFCRIYSAEIGHRLNGSDAKTSSTGLSLLYQHFGVGCPNAARLTAHP